MDDTLFNGAWFSSKLCCRHRQFRKLTKTKGGFSSEQALLKLLYAGMMNASERWTMPIANWGQTMAQLSIHFHGRLDGIMKI